MSEYYAYVRAKSGFARNEYHMMFRRNMTVVVQYKEYFVLYDLEHNRIIEQYSGDNANHMVAAAVEYVKAHGQELHLFFLSIEKEKIEKELRNINNKRKEMIKALKAIEKELR